MKPIVFAFLLFSANVWASLPLDKIKLPPGFSISIYASNVEGARSMAWGKNGILFVGSRTAGKVTAIEPSGKKYVIASGLRQPNGVAFKDGTLYVAEVHRIIKFEHISDQLQKPPAPVELVSLPVSEIHGWRYLALGPGHRLFFGQGAPCNNCEVQDPFGTIMSVDLKGGDMKVHARGVRNSIGFDWHPVSGQMFFTDNGRDMLGENIPADELNRITAEGQHFGFPYCHAGDIIDPEFAKTKDCASFAGPAKKLGAHAAALGMRFYTGEQFPEKYRGQIFISEHGSWNRRQPLGYRISVVTLDGNSNATSYETFAQGWLMGSQAWGRPVDVLVAPDGALLVSDDHADVIYKISFKAK